MDISEIVNYLSSTELIKTFISGGLYGLVLYLLNKLYKYFNSIEKVVRSYNIYLLTILLYLLYVLLLKHLENFSFFTKDTFSISVIFGSILTIFILYRYISKLRKIGLIGSDLEIKKGIDYLQTIKTAKTEFSFLGVGAKKLTSNNDEFEKMVERVNRNGNQVKLLLCHPDSKSLSYLAERANKSPDDYSHKVKTSLKYLSKLVIDKGYSIDIRYYESLQINDMPIFRIVFLNTLYCLTSYTQFGDSSHEGESMPQMHFIANNIEDNSNSFYFAYKTFFDRLWDKNKDNNFDLKKYKTG